MKAAFFGLAMCGLASVAILPATAKAADPVIGAAVAVGQGTVMAPATAVQSVGDHINRYGPPGVIPGAIAAGFNFGVNLLEVPYNVGAAVAGGEQLPPSSVRF